MSQKYIAYSHPRETLEWPYPLDNNLKTAPAWAILNQKVAQLEAELIQAKSELAALGPLDDSSREHRLI